MSNRTYRISPEQQLLSGPETIRSRRMHTTHVRGSPARPRNARQEDFAARSLCSSCLPAEAASDGVEGLPRVIPSTR
jgi:hypothetical protein